MLHGLLRHTPRPARRPRRRGGKDGGSR
jgi:hypothetical protein